MNSLLLKLLCWEEKDRLELSSLVLPKMLWEIFFFNGKEFCIFTCLYGTHRMSSYKYCAIVAPAKVVFNPPWPRNYQYTRVYSLTMEKAMAPHSSTLAWKIPWMEEPGGLQSMGSLRVGHN